MTPLLQRDANCYKCLWPVLCFGAQAAGISLSRSWRSSAIASNPCFARCFALDDLWASRLSSTWYVQIQNSSIQRHCTQYKIGIGCITNMFLRGEVICCGSGREEAARGRRGGLAIRGRGPALLRRLALGTAPRVARGAVDAALHFPFFSLGKKVLLL